MPRKVTELAVKRFEAEVLKNQSHLFEVQQQITVMRKPAELPCRPLSAAHQAQRSRI
jgi:hypothetical protein